jgi:small subunit ribosomal protein S15
MPKRKKSENKENKMEKPVWLKYTEEEVKGVILKLANKGLTSEKIGLTLKDQYGIPKTKLFGFKIKEVLDEKGKYEDESIKNLKARAEKVQAHYKKHKGDKKAELSLTRTKAKLKKREEYRKRKAA